MTCFEKFKLDNPDNEMNISELARTACPHWTIDIKMPEECAKDPHCSECVDCWSREIPGTEPIAPTIKDSGTRQEFPTGAVRDIQKGKGRCDLLPLDVIADCYRADFGMEEPEAMIFDNIQRFMETGLPHHLHNALAEFIEIAFGNCWSNMLLEVSMHFEEGAEKYGENNWQKGLPVKCYINSAVRHYLKFLREDSDERHDRAFCWNILCAIWTCKHKPELNEYGQKVCPVCNTVIPDGETECPHCRVFTGTPDFLCELEEEYV